LRPAERVRSIAVVGGGPVGLELARRAARRGHHVVLLEREPLLGGRARLAARLDPETARFVAWLEQAAREAGVQIQLGSEATASGLRGSADLFVVATGGRRAAALERIPGAPRVEAVEALGELLDSLAPSRRITVSGSDVVAVKSAEALALAGHSVTLLEQGAFAPEMGLPRRWRAADLLARLGVVRVKAATELALSPGGLRYHTAKHAGEVACELLLDARRLEGDESLAEALRAGGAEAHAIGDCRGPRYLEAGLLEAARLAATL
jgi:NADPH-dependent 2,4-dienoyl-CoA reductase/sulfur reductase-like enzyme